MSKKIDERIPNTVGNGIITDYPPVATPWGRMTPYYEAAQPSQ